MAAFTDFDFNVLHENVFKVNFTQTSKIYDYNSFSDLLDKALQVKNFSIFSNIEIPNFTNFIPFAYQKDSIKTMLEKFEGKGVFGDQVGLGKTIQVLITADIMFRNNEISNAVIVCPKTLVDQWKNEILTKVPENFYIVPNKNNKLVNEFESIKNLFDENLIKPDKLNVVFVDSDNFKSRKVANQAAKNIKDKNESLKIIEKLEGDIRNFETDINNLIARDKKQLEMAIAIQGISAEEVYAAHPPIKEILGKIEETKFSIEAMKHHIAELDETQLFNKPIDLLVIDESHKVIDQIQNSEFSEMFDSMERKYTILLSATPIEKNIDDIYDLVRFVDKNRFTDLDKFHAYVDNATSLNELVSKPHAMDRLNGLINSLFTRKRLQSEEVQSSLAREYDLEIVGNVLQGKKDEAYAIIDELKDKEKAEACKAHLDKFYKNKNHENIIGDIRHFIFKSTYPLRKTFFSNNMDEEIPLDRFLKNEQLTQFFNFYLCNYFKETHEEFVFPFIKWSPSNKIINNIKKEEMNNMTQDDCIVQKLNEDIFCKASKVIIYKSANSMRFALLKKLHAELGDRTILCDVTIKKFYDAFKINSSAYDIRDFLDTEIFPYCNLGEKRINEFKKRFIETASLVSSTNRDVVKELHTLYKNFILELFNDNTEDLSNSILLMDYTRFEGSDLHCASQLMLCQKTQMVDFNSSRFEPIDPLTLEQFIGRIYRIGQPTEANITIFPEGSECDTLFEIYNDTEGLDLFGAGKNEIGFVVPIIVERWKEKILNLKEYNNLKYEYESNIEPDSFVHVYQILYRINRKFNKNLIPEFEKDIRLICNKLAIGKKVA